MSVENLKKFGEAVANSKEYQEKCKEIGLENIDDLMAFAKELGYEFNAEDAKALADEAGITSEELSEEDLEKVAGGAATTTVALFLIAAAAVGLAGVGVGAGVVGFAGAASGKW